ncbi:MAG: YihY/virulence factor BrkB family protein [Bacteroidia bacterium]|nr:YihY/virulence factor BrkB family protein [Bacteroidia bacterium]MCZ2249667.1 YihY/virulence factor BrkB family protein [Bacteroidia bacterium]
MLNIKEWKSKLLNNKLIVLSLALSKKIILPGFERVPLYYVIDFFIQGLKSSALGTQAASLSFRFFLAIFPGLIFLFTLIPYIPVPDFQEQLLLLLKGLMPHAAFEATRDTFEDLINNKQGGLLSFGFIFALYLATDGVNAMMQGFNQSNHIEEKRSGFKIRLISIMLVVIITVLITISIAIIVMSNWFSDYLLEHQLISKGISYYALLAGKWLVLLCLLFTAISFLYYFGPSGKVHYKFISAGSTLATIFIIIVSSGFAFYVNNFASYNKLYGSIGTIIVVMLLINFNVFVVLLGYELNKSIYLAKQEQIPQT